MIEHRIESIAVEVGETERVYHVGLQNGEAVRPGVARLAAILFAGPATAEPRRVEEILAVVRLSFLGTGMLTVDGAVAIGHRSPSFRQVYIQRPGATARTP
jgi:hypothetical protein